MECRRSNRSAPLLLYRLDRDRSSIRDNPPRPAKESPAEAEATVL